MSDGETVDDHEVAGLAGERTDLAWSRSGLAVVACLAAIAKRVLPDLSTLDGRAVLAVALGIGAVAWGFSMLWARAVARTALSGRLATDPRTLRAVAFGTAALGVVATILALVPDS